MNQANDESRERTRILRRKDVLQITGLSQSSLYRMMHMGKFPKPLQLTPGTVGWKSDSVMDWINSLKTSNLGKEVNID